jgi:8-oxo-dGTP diphosphatase
VYEQVRERARRPLPWLGRTWPVRDQPPARFERAGAGPGGFDWSVRRACWLVQTGGGTLLTDELAWTPPFGPAGRLADALLLRRALLRALVTNAAAVKAGAERAGGAGQPAGPAGLPAARPAVVRNDPPPVPAARPAAASAEPPPGPAVSIVDAGVLVVGAALFDPDGRVLAAQRDHPPELAGRWEFPGGKVEPGESETAALARECQEELGVGIQVEARLGGDLPVAGGGLLRVWRGRITAGEPSPREHRALRWLAADELDDVDWLPADRPLIDLLRPPAQQR